MTTCRFFPFRPLWLVPLLAVSNLGSAAPAAARISPVDLPARTVSVPRVEVPLLRSHRLPMVEVRVNGAGPYRFLLDWGANVVAVSARLVRDLHLATIGTDEKGNANVHVDEIRIGEDSFLGITAL
ncbi:MAG: aspartyl protease family protein, partial [Thermoanaerobaculia bacterium]